MKFHTRLLVSATTLILLHTPSFAQEGEYDQLSRMNALEEEIRDLRGGLEETQHQLSTLKQQMETLNADIDYRLNNTESKTMPPLPLPPDVPSVDEPTVGNSNNGYEAARTLLEQGDYEAAERAFAAFVASHPKDKQAGAAQYWLGVTFFVRGQHEKAVAAFAKGYKTYPKSEKAGDNMLKLAKSLAALDRKADACTALDQLSSDHPKFSVKEVASERKKLNCK
jgi:tol-pal system protein YbgF